MSTLWVYARIQVMMFVFGIVGPIFLVGYFAAQSSQPDPSLKWMFWWGLFITAGDIIIALMITESVVRKDSEIAEKAARKRQGQED